MATIVLIEDEIFIRRLFRLVLERSGDKVIEASSSAELWDGRLDRSTPALLISDVKLSDAESGTEVAWEFYQRYDVPVILMSGLPPTMWTEQNQQSLAKFPKNAVYLLTKPFVPATLMKLVGELLERSVESGGSLHGISSVDPPRPPAFQAAELRP